MTATTTRYRTYKGVSIYLNRTSNMFYYLDSQNNAVVFDDYDELRAHIDGGENW